MEKFIASLQSIQQLRKGDLIFQLEKGQQFLVDAVSHDHLVVSDVNESRALSVIYFSQLMSGKWQVRLGS
jgi:hypothetical protein